MTSLATSLQSTEPAPARSVPDTLSRTVLLVILLGATLLQRFAIPLGSAQLALTNVVTWSSIALLLVSGRMVVDLNRLLLFSAMASVLLLTSLIGEKRTSVESIALLLVIYGIYVWQMRSSRAEHAYALRLFQSIMTLFAAVGLAQFFAQFVVPREWLFPFDLVIDQSYFMSSYNYIIPLSYGSEVIKSNGVVFLEPSFFSQFLAIGLVIECLFFLRWTRLFLLGAALFVSFSGTGLTLAALFIPWILVRRGQLKVLLLIAITLCLLFLIRQSIYLDVFMARSTELGSTDTSGFGRFIGPMWLISDYLVDDPLKLLFGIGAGSIEGYVQQTAYLSHDPPWAKVLFEYGLVGGVSFFAYFLYCVMARSPSPTLSAALLYLFLFLGGYLLSGPMHAMILVLIALHRPPAGPAGNTFGSAEKFNRLAI